MRGVLRGEAGGGQRELARPGLPRARLLGRAVVKPEDEQVPYMLRNNFV